MQRSTWMRADGKPKRLVQNNTYSRCAVNTGKHVMLNSAKTTVRLTMKHRFS